MIMLSVFDCTLCMILEITFAIGYIYNDFSHLFLNDYDTLEKRGFPKLKK